MRRNFRLAAGGAKVIVGDVRIDLHNLYRVTDISTDPAGEAFICRFARDHEWQGPADLPEHVSLRCTGDLRLAFTNLADLPLPPDDFGFEIWYFDDDCPWDHFLDEKLAERQGLAGLHVGFGDGLVVRVRCAEAEILTGRPERRDAS